MIKRTKNVSKTFFLEAVSFRSSIKQFIILLPLYKIVNFGQYKNYIYHKTV